MTEPPKNQILVQWASNALLWQLVKRGCDVYRQPPPFDHSKLAIVDDAWVLLGSANLDPRSLRLNFEFNVECYDVAFASEVTREFEDKLAAATPITGEDLDARSLPVQLRDGLARLASPYL